MTYSLAISFIHVGLKANRRRAKARRTRVDGGHGEGVENGARKGNCSYYRMRHVLRLETSMNKTTNYTWTRNKTIKALSTRPVTVADEFVMSLPAARRRGRGLRALTHAVSRTCALESRAQFVLSRAYCV
ncbi:hypothetical protein EVAR_6609_1 [Eumeta japonica]|uniref:Uncharacterized protein n=1 Tax=Eumeta variegata TaxID=151549 RepID=A0A4C1TN43_EUMVA|nr:hypothetical protein EVAR_6609_1 [Eumeta japonica]